MKKFFSRIKAKTFKILAIVFCGMGDIIIVAYLWDLFSDYGLFKKALKLGFPGHREFLDEEFQRQLFQINLKSLKIMLVLYLIFHIFHYICFYLNKKFAYIYLKIMVWVAGPGIILAGLSYAGKGNLIQHLLLPQGLLYLFVGMGMLYFPYKSKEN
jgi:hypothetical protein